MELSQLKGRLDPKNEQHRAILQILGKVQIMKGEPGYTPVKGKDYFTPEEVSSLLKSIESYIKTFEKGLKGEKGDTGPAGRDGVGSRGPKGEAGENGKNGHTPVHGVDYFTPKDQAILINRILPKIKVPTVEEVARKVKESPISYKEIVDAPDLKDLPALINFLKAGGFRGGGSSSSTSSTGYQQPTGAVNGVNQIFVFAVAPTVISVDGGRMMQKTSSDGTVNWTGTTTITLAIAPLFDIFGIA